MKVLLTGGSGFIAAHVLEGLLRNGHSVVTTVRSQDKADKIKQAYPKHGKDTLDFSIVPDIAKADAFDHVFQDHKGFEAVVHTASPFHFNITDPKKDLVDPAVIGTTGVLRSITQSPTASKSVTRVVITSSFASIIDASKANDPSTTFTEKSWNPVTIDAINDNPATAYRASKKLAEAAAWDFVKGEEYKKSGANFDLTTVCPPLVFGPVVHYLASLDSINTSNARIASCVNGTWRKDGKIPDTGNVTIFVDVRDVAKAHVLAAERKDLGGKRLFTYSGQFSHKAIVDIVRKDFPELKGEVPEEGTQGGGSPEEGKIFKTDNSVTKKELGFEWIGLEKCIGDTVKSLEPFLGKK